MSQSQRQHPKPTSALTRPPQTQLAGESTRWTREHDRAFERALVIFPEDHPDRWEKMAKHIPGGWSPSEIKEHYEKLLHDVIQIESGRVELPMYSDDFVGAAAVEEAAEYAAAHGGSPQVWPPPVRSKKGTAWTEEEHRLFLIGLNTYGKGDWRSIARYVVLSRTPTQVASHAQKYFLRQNASRKERKRTSIHDITIGDDDLIPHPTHQQNWVPPPQNWVPPPQNWVPSPDVPTQQLQEMQQAQEMLQLNPPNNLPQQMGGFGHFNNCF